MVCISVGEVTKTEPIPLVTGDEGFGFGYASAMDALEKKLKRALDARERKKMMWKK